MSESRNERLGLAELAARSGVPPRTIRYYISRGLLPRPIGGGRGAAYGEAHLERIAEIQRLKERGLTLAEIGRSLDPGPEGALLGPPTSWSSYPIGDDVVLNIRSDVSPWRLRQILGAAEALARRIGIGGEGEEGKDDRSGK